VNQLRLFDILFHVDSVRRWGLRRGDFIARSVALGI
jgi:hypothetical protein